MDSSQCSMDRPALFVMHRQSSPALARPGIEVRAEPHTGEIELDGDDVTGIAVAIGARVGAIAEPSEVLVSQTIKDLTAGSGIAYVERGEHDSRASPINGSSTRRQLNPGWGRGNRSSCHSAPGSVVRPVRWNGVPAWSLRSLATAGYASIVAGIMFLADTAAASTAEPRPSQGGTTATLTRSANPQSWAKNFDNHAPLSFFPMLGATPAAPATSWCANRL